MSLLTETSLFRVGIYETPNNRRCMSNNCSIDPLRPRGASLTGARAHRRAQRARWGAPTTGLAPHAVHKGSPTGLSNNPTADPYTKTRLHEPETVRRRQHACSEQPAWHSYDLHGWTRRQERVDRSSYSTAKVQTARGQQCAVLLDKGYLLSYTDVMKPYLPLALALAIWPVGGTLAQTGSQKAPHIGNFDRTVPHAVQSVSPVAAAAPIGAPPVSPVPTDAPPAVPLTATPLGPPAQDTTPVTEPLVGLTQPPAIGSQQPPATTGSSTPAPAAPEPLLPPPATPPAPEPMLQITAVERQYFDFGCSLATAAFAYADLARQIAAIPEYHRHDRTGQMQLLAALNPVVLRDRGVVRDSLSRTLAQMHSLQASPSALAIVSQGADMVNRPILLTGDAKVIATVNARAGQTLAGLNEFERISGITQSPAISAWLNGPGKNSVGNVWYAEGLISGVAAVASAQNLPDLLPPVSEISTDLRGLRDWLLIRMPDNPTAAQSLLRKTLDGFLRSTSWPQVQDRPVSPAELAMLGTISRELQNQVLLTAASSTATEPAASLTASSPPVTGKAQLIDGIAH
jgi:hypothetical protein